MKIAIDVSAVVYETGVSVYTSQLVRKLLEIDKVNEYLLFAGTLRRKKDIKSFYDSLDGNFEGRIFTIPPTLADVIGNRYRFAHIEKLIGKVDVFHSSDWTQPPSEAFKVTTIHDLVPLKFPRLTHPRILTTQKRRLEHVKKEADRIIVPSVATKEDVIGLGIKEEIISVIPEAVDPIFNQTETSGVDAVKNKYRISGKYILAVGANPRKNTDRIIEAHSNIKSSFKVKLVIIGLHYNKVENKRGVIYTGHVAAEDVPLLYKGAEALIYPSLYEGFGLPILEAFASGTPVVTSNLSSMKEVAGDAAVLVDPYEVDSISEGIKTALNRKVTYRKKGFKRQKLYSWEKTAEMTLKVYNNETI